MQGLIIVATFTGIKESDRDAFKDVVRELVAMTKGEAGVGQYDWFFSEDETECVLHECYDSSETVIARMPRTGPTVGRLTELSGGLDVRVFGDVSAELRAGLAPMAAEIYAFFAGT